MHKLVLGISGNLPCDVPFPEHVVMYTPNTLLHFALSSPGGDYGDV